MHVHRPSFEEQTLRTPVFQSTCIPDPLLLPNSVKQPKNDDNNNNDNPMESNESLSVRSGGWTWIWICLGWQFASVLLTLVSVLSQILNNRGWHCSTLMNFPMYLCLFFWSSLWVRRSSNSSFSLHHSSDFPITKEDETTTMQDLNLPINQPLMDSNNNNNNNDSERISNYYLRLFYLIASLADVSGNALVLRAFEYTSIASVTLLDFFTIPCVYGLSMLFIGSQRRRYSLSHLMSVMLCLFGMTLLVLSNHDNRASGPKHRPLLGDSLVLCGALCYSISNCFAEFILSFNDSDYYQSSNDSNFNHASNDVSVALFLQKLSFLSAGFSLAIGLSIPSERGNLAMIMEDHSSVMEWLYFAFYTLGLSLYYFTVSFMMSQGSTALSMNVSLLTSDAYSLIFACLLFGFHLDFTYALCMLLIFTGVLWFNFASPKPIDG